MRVCLLVLVLLRLCAWQMSASGGPMSPVSVVTSCEMMSMGTGNTIVLLFSAEMLFRVCRYLRIVVQAQTRRGIFRLRLCDD